MKSQRLLELDVLRGLAALAVVIHHYFHFAKSLYLDANISTEWTQVGQYGIELFFIISGFVIFWTLNRVKQPLDFIVSRFSRLYPAYWCAIIITFLTVSYFGLQGKEVSLYHALLNFIMIQEYFRVPPVDGVYWTLTIELTFYFWMFVFYLLNSLDKVEKTSIFLITLSILHSLSVVQIPAFLHYILLLQYIPFFVAGICFYKIINNEKSKLTIMLILLTLLSTIVIFSFEHFLLFSGFYGAFYFAISDRLKFISIKPLVFLGGISYSLYLIHQNVGYVIISELYKLNWPPYFAILLSISVSISLATLISKFVEKPSLKHIRNYYQKSGRIQAIAKKSNNFITKKFY